MMTEKIYLKHDKMHCDDTKYVLKSVNIYLYVEIHVINEKSFLFLCNNFDYAIELSVIWDKINRSRPPTIIPKNKKIG